MKIRAMFEHANQRDDMVIKTEVVDSQVDP